MTETRNSAGAVLVVDDDEELLESSKSYFEEVGIDGEVASSADEGLRLLGKKSFLLIILDVRMPGKNGIAFVMEAVSRNLMQGARVIAVTGEFLDEETEELFAARGISVVSKGEFNIDDISEILESPGRALAPKRGDILALKMQVRTLAMELEEQRGLSKMLVASLLERMRTRMSNTRQPSIFLRDRRFSIEELSGEIEAMTPAGRDFVRIYEEYIQSILEEKQG